MEQEASQKKSSVRIDILDWGMQTTLWDEIDRCVRESVGDDEVTVANALSAVRQRQLYAIGVFVDGLCKAIALARHVNDGYSGKRAMLIYGVCGELDLDQWKDAFSSFCVAAGAQGCSRVMANTRQESVVRLASALGFSASTTLEKELANG